jgi:hypothetical protein
MPRPTEYVKSPAKEKLDYPFLVFKQIDRVLEALSAQKIGARYDVINAINGLESLVFHLVANDQEYKTRLADINKKYKAEVEDLGSRVLDFRDQQQLNQIMLKKTMRKFKILIMLLDKHNLFPRESKSIEA